MRTRITKERLFNQIWMYLSLFNRPSYPLNLPTTARIEATNRCNLACQMCLHQLLKEIDDMDFNIYKKIIDLLPRSIARVILAGFGEPLLHKNIFEMVRYAKFKHKYTEIYTNATILDKDMSKNLLASGLDSLHFSMDGATKSTYEYLRVGAKFDIVIQNITEFMTIQKEISNPPHVAMRVVIMKENLHEACKFIELAHELNISDVLFQAMQSFWNCGFSKSEHSIHHMKEMEKVRQKLRNAKEKARKLNVQLKLPTIDFTTKIRCLQPWYLICIDWQGLVNPCCAVYDVQVGNILNQPLKNIWRGPKWITWRKRMRSSSPPTQCRDCCDR